MTQRLLDFALHTCVLLAAVQGCTLVARSSVARVWKSVALVLVLSAGAVLSLAMSAAWYRVPVAAVPWLGIFVLLAGAWQGPIVGSWCVCAIAIGTLLLDTMAMLPAVGAWPYKVLGVAWLGLGAAWLLRRTLPAGRDLVVLTLAALLAAAGEWLRELRSDVPADLGAWAQMIALAVLGTWVGQRAMAASPWGEPRAREGLRAHEAAARQGTGRLAVILENAVEGIALLELDGTVMHVNPALGRLSGILPASLVGSSWLELAPPSERTALAEALALARSQGRAMVECLLLVDEGSLPVELTLIRDGPADAARGVHLLVRDLRERKATARFEHLALHDQLTGLPNRRALLDRLEDALRASPGRRAKLAVLLFDIDKFKHINDTLGHAAGDAVLSHVAAQMLRVVRPTDTLGRLGGDEFVLIARGIETIASAESLAQRFRSEAARPLRLGGGDVSVQLSVGCALVEQGSDSPERILERADRAMYAEKGRSPSAKLPEKRAGQTKPLFGKR